MFKKLNMFALALLIIGQTILGPIGIASANANDIMPASQPAGEESDSTAQATEVETNDTTDATEVVEPEDSVEESEADASTGAEERESSEATDGEKESEEPEVNGTKKPQASSPATTPEVEGGESEIGEEPEEDGEEISPLADGSPDNLNENDIKNVTFKPTPNSNGKVDVVHGDTANFRFELNDLEADHGHGPGSSLTIDLPPEFTGLTKGGSANVGDVEIVEEKAVFTFNQGVIDDNTGLVAATNGVWFEFTATFNNDSTDLEKQVTIPGGLVLDLNFIPVGGKEVTKEAGKPKNSDGTDAIKNPDYLEWTVTVNTDLKGNGEFKDVLMGDDHKFKQEDVTVTELTMKGDGSSSAGTPTQVSPTLNSEKTEMTLNLNPEKAYKITYKTYPENIGNGGNKSYSNQATYSGKSAENFANNIPFDTGIKKSVGFAKADLTTDWVIVVNENKRDLGKITVTDKWATTGGSANAKQELVGSVKVYQENGTTEVTTGVSFNQDEITDGQGFNIVFDNAGTNTYVIKYTTKPTADTYIQENMTVKNGVTRSDDDETFKDSKSVTYDKNSHMLNKTTPSIDYNTKKIEWSIVANQAKETLEEPLFEDRFTNANMKLDGEPVVKVNGVEQTKGTDYTFTELADNKGFDIEFLNDVSEQVTITYTTDYIIKNIGHNENVYKNDIKLISKNDVPDIEDWAQRSSTQKPEQEHNGKKDGKYNYEKKRFEWEVELNFNLNEFQNAIFEDTISNTPGQTIDPETVKVYEGTLTSDGVFQQGDKVTSGITKEVVNGNTLKVELGAISTPHKIVYESYVTDDVIPETDGKLQVTNTATLTDNGTLNTSWTKTVGVNYTDKLINKTGKQLKDDNNLDTAGIEWSFEFNYAQSHLEEIEITDDVGRDTDGNPNQLYKEDSFKVYPVTLSGKSDKDSFGAAIVSGTALDPSEYDLNVNVKEGKFTLKLPAGDKAYKVVYETVYLGANGEEVKNQVAVSYKSADGESAVGHHSFSNFTYDGGGDIIKVPFVVVKTDGETGGIMPEAIEFTLYHTASGKLFTDTTDENGVFDLGFSIAEGDYYLTENNVPAGYVNPGNIPLLLHRKNVETDGLYKGYQVVEVENFPENYVEKCDIFTITATDVDGKSVSEVTLTNKLTGKAYTSDSGDNEGSFTFDRTGDDKLPAGKYTVTAKDQDGKSVVYEKEVTVDSETCSDGVTVAPTCPSFTITVKDVNGKERVGAIVTLVDENNKKVVIDGETEFTTGENGEIKIPSGQLPAGEYSVHEDGVKIGNTITVSYKDECKAEVQPFPACDDFTIIVKDVDGDERKNVEIILKDKDGQTVVIKDNSDNPVTLKTDDNGEVTIPSKQLPAGKYQVYEGDNKLDDIDVSYTDGECRDEVQPTPACDVFIFEFKDKDGKPKVGVEITLESVKTGEKYTYTTNEDGRFNTEAKIPAGNYKVYEGELFHGEETVSYKDMECGTDHPAVVIDDQPTCEIFTLTVKDRNGNPRPDVDKITIKDADGNPVSYEKNGVTVDSFETDSNGQIKLPNTIKPGTYTVYEDGKRINTFTVKTDCTAEVKPPTGGGGGWIPPTPDTCDIFTIIVKQNGTTVGANVDLTFKSGATEVKGSTNTDGKIVINKNNLPAGKYTAYDKDGKEVGSVNVSYDQGQCQDEIDLLVKACDVFTVTVKQSDKTVGAGTSVTLKDADGKTVTTGTTNKDGQITFNKDDLTAGSYTAYDKDGKKIGDVKVAYDGNCAAELNLPAPSCDVFTITVKKSGETVKAGTTLSLKDATGKTVVTGTTNVNGKIVFDKAALPKGTYTAVDKDGKEIAKVTVSYDEGKCQAVVDILLKACEHFNLTVVDTPNKTVQIKDKDGNIVATGKTDANGKVTFTQSIPEGNYDVYIDGKKVGNLPVKDTCEGTITPQVDPEKPDPGKPVDPNKPDDGGSGTPGGDKPGDGSGSNTPDGGKPGGDSGSNTPGGNKPGGNSGSNTPGGDKPDTNGNVSTPGGKLPQTGEEQFLYMIVLGSLLIIGGGAMFIGRRRKEN